MFKSNDNSTKTSFSKGNTGMILLISGAALLIAQLIEYLINLVILDGKFVNTASTGKIILSVCLNILPLVIGIVLAVAGIFFYKKNKGESTIAIKRNIYALFLSIIFVVGVVLVIALSSTLAKKYPLDIDLTTNKQHSISNDNFEYISGIDETIKIYVAATEDQYNSVTGTKDDIAYVAASLYAIDYNKDNAVYYQQTVELLKKYADYNDNITISFLDIYDSKTREITDDFEDFSWSMGDVLVESTFKLNGKDVTRRTIVPLAETYTLEDKSSYAEKMAENPEYVELYYGISAKMGYGYGYHITENNVEYMMSAALYKVTSPDTPLFLVPTSVSDNKSVSSALQKVLEVNNFAIEYNDALLSTLLTEGNYDKYDGIILSNCKADISTTDRELIEKFLDNKGNKGKSLYYFAGTNAFGLTNLNGLLGDWGIGFEDGFMYETDSGYHQSGNPTILALESTKSDFTQSSDALNRYYIGSNLVNMRVLYQTNTSATHTRETTVLMATASLGKTAIMPSGEKVDEWKAPTDADSLDKRIAAILCEDADAVDGKFVSSYVLAFASSDIIIDTYNTDTFGNLNLVLDTFNQVTGNADAPFTFVPKKIETATFYADVTEGEVKAIRWIFIGVVPVIVFSLGLFAWIWRKRK